MPYFSTIVKVLSALIATLTTCLIVRHPHTIIVTSAIVMTCAGWLYVGSSVRLIGIIHAIFMLIIGSYFLSIGLKFFLKPPGLIDNPSAGMITLANFAITAIGALVFTSGVAVILLTSKKNNTK